jgi:hypothetical protein
VELPSPKPNMQPKLKFSIRLKKEQLESGRKAVQVESKGCSWLGGRKAVLPTISTFITPDIEKANRRSTVPLLGVSLDHLT